jgi:site-specific DNA recombinase
VSAEAIESLVAGSLRQGLPKARQVEWAELSSAQKRDQVERLIERVTIMADSIELRLTEAGRSLVAAKSELIRIAITMKAALGGRQIVQRDGPASGRIDRSLVKAIARAYDLRHRLERSGDIGLHDLAREDGCSRPYVSSMIRLAYLAPAITQAILDGAQPAHLTLADLMQRDIPVDWNEQRRAFGFL